ncbi:allantoate amidohydrolase [Salimicrobium jeotgali]|uniref:Allantoate amidohydrolase n=1 Tax=Salimicrobium jeotgali TaxID=1230341 RepID=K2GMT2_9BACI|nr:M20 family metallo-hydrolase [Salimicrobium jeotgali]AKG04786.1 allantoate amidohydrolase [Salimicrobium jeotgali]EKE31704.1 allantoate amidohydrolase [Salimicrobium jeotgali]MBM7696337.1 allantoate deiminase [Salimicrobium jeotgali]
MQENELYSNLMNDYNSEFDRNGVSGQRVATRLHKLSEIGRTGDGGSFRLGFSGEEQEAKKLLKSWMREAGLTVSEDEAGNVFGRMRGRNEPSSVLMSGSHLDSVPNGGHFDGPVGVISSLEIVEAWNASGFLPDFDYEVVVFSDEEGSRFQSGLTGSRAMTGKVDMDIQKGLKDSEGAAFSEVIHEVGLSASTFAEAANHNKNIKEYVEIHIEQGKVLEKENLPVGIVSGIAGPCWLSVTFTGHAGHAGNTPMPDRRDPLVAAGAFVSSVPDMPGEVSESAVATVGKLEVRPNGANVIPGTVELIVDIRDIRKEDRNVLTDRIIEEAETLAKKHDVDVEYQQNFEVSPVPVPAETKEFLRSAVNDEGIRAVEIPSGAGHDALVIGHRYPVAMLFIRNKDGISHTPEEWAGLNDIVQGIHVLKTYLEKK